VHRKSATFLATLNFRGFIHRTDAVTQAAGGAAGRANVGLFRCI